MREGDSITPFKIKMSRLTNCKAEKNDEYVRYELSKLKASEGDTTDTDTEKSGDLKEGVAYSHETRMMTYALFIQIRPAQGFLRCWD